MLSYLTQSPWLAPARFVWRKLLRTSRAQSILEKRLLYPRLPHIRRKPSYPGGPTLLAGFFSSNLGLGEAARLELAHMRESGQDAVGVDISPAFGLSDMPLPEGVVPRHAAPCLGPLILHCNAPEAGRALQHLGEGLTCNRHITGYWAWELETAPHNWHLAYNYLDALWVPSRHTAKAFGDAPLPLAIHAHPVPPVPDSGHSLSDLGFPDAEGKRIFLCMADGRSDLIRKNIAGAVRAFGVACGDSRQSCLIVKLHHSNHAGAELERARALCARWSNVYLAEKDFSQARRNSLLHRAHVLLSLHRAEGFGLALAEAQALGKKIIATAYSGPMDFLAGAPAESCALIAWTPVPVRSNNANYAPYTSATWAEPVEQDAVRAIHRFAAASPSGII